MEINTKRTSCFVNDWYYDQFIVMYKSYLYYGNTNPFRVYDWDNMKQDNVDMLKSIGVEVVKVEQGDWSNLLYRNSYCFKWKGLIESDIDYELLVDADTLFLDNVDDILENFDGNELIVVPEYFKKDMRAGNLFNIGFMGYKKTSKYLLEQSVERCKTKDYTTEMFELCNIIEEQSIKVKELPYQQYMPLWHNHKIKKNVVVENGKFVVHDENNNKLRFYHFTTHIDPFMGSPVLRFGLDHNTTARMWVKRFDNPVGLIYSYFNFAEDFNTIKETIEQWKLKR